MEYRRLGRSGLQLSAFSLGSWVTFGRQVDLELAQSLMKTAFDSGVNFFDNAEAYGHGESERIMGETIQKLGLRRDSFCVSSKVFWGGDAATQQGLSRKHVFEACHAALKRLSLDYLDLFFCHRPDPYTPIEETVWAMHQLIMQGKVLYWGTSEWSASEIAQAHAVCNRNNLIPPSMEQPQYNLFHRHRVEQEYRRLYEDFGLGTTTWSPLASGVLTGKYKHGIPTGSRMSLPDYQWLRDRLESEEGKKRIEFVNELEKIAREKNCTVAQLSLAWCLKNKNVSTVILGASQVKQLQECLQSLEVYKNLQDSDTKTIDQISEKYGFNVKK